MMFNVLLDFAYVTQMPLLRCAKQPRGVGLISRLTKPLNNVTYQDHG
jgi:hypothetical protein